MVRKKRIKPEQDAKEHILLGKDKAFIEGPQINTFKGRGVFALEHIESSTFVVENVEDVQGNYLFDFTWNGTRYCIDATKEDGSLGRLVNDDHRNPNCKVKTIIVDGRPHLCLFSMRDIFPDEEVTYNYGDSSWPWRLRELCDETSVTVTECSVNPSSSVNEKMTCKDKSKTVAKKGDSALTGNEMELCDETSVTVTECSVNPFSSVNEKCRHEVHSAVISSLDSCEDCSGPVSSRKWLGLTCKLCSRSWHKTCFLKNKTLPDVEFSSFEESSSEECSPYVDKNADISSSAQDLICDNHDTATDDIEMLQRFKKTPAVSSFERSDTDNVQNPKNTFSTQKNYCYVCKKPQSKIACHFKKHQDSETEIAAAFLLPKHSQDRKRLLEKLRNRGNYEHNQEIMESKSGPLKVRRRPGKSEIELSAKTYVHCVNCKGLFVRKELWRHTRRCSSKMSSESEATGKRKTNQDETENSRETKSRKTVKRPWSPNEVNAVMKHFKVHISKGHLATKTECEQCKTTEDPVLRERTVQNIRDFVRNRGLMLKKKCS